MKLFKEDRLEKLIFIFIAFWFCLNVCWNCTKMCHLIQLNWTCYKLSNFKNGQKLKNKMNKNLAVN